MDIRQLVNDPTDPFLSTPEYEFLYKMYKGTWNRHIDQEDSMFSDIWEFMNDQQADEIFFHEAKPIMEQDHQIGTVRYRALWFEADRDPRRLLGPPDVITWQTDMLPPGGIQPSLF